MYLVSVYLVYLSPPLTPEGPAPCGDMPRQHFLSPTSTPGTFSLPKVKLLTKTPSVKQLYQSLLQALRNISGNREDFLPELTKPFFEKVLRDFEQKQSLQVIKVKVRDKKEFGRHFCSEVHAVDVTVKAQSSKILFLSHLRSYYSKLKKNSKNYRSDQIQRKEITSDISLSVFQSFSLSVFQSFSLSV